MLCHIVDGGILNCTVQPFKIFYPVFFYRVRENWVNEAIAILAVVTTVGGIDMDKITVVDTYTQ